MAAQRRGPWRLLTGFRGRRTTCAAVLAAAAAAVSIQGLALCLQGGTVARRPTLRPVRALRRRQDTRPRRAPGRSRIPLAAWTAEELRDRVVNPREGHAHTHTLIYLHAFAHCGAVYTKPLMERLSRNWPLPWIDDGGAHYAPGLRVVLPTARKMTMPWGDNETSWHLYKACWHNDVGDRRSLEETRRRLAEVVRSEVARLDGAADRVFLGGLSQGCTAALDVYLQHAVDLGLGGFVGNVGFVPADRQGFVGASQAFRRLLDHEGQAAKPLWLQCAVDDNKVPWDLTEPSIKWAIPKLPNLCLKTVKGRGHAIDDWEGHLLNSFIRLYAEEAYR